MRRQPSIRPARRQAADALVSLLRGTRPVDREVADLLEQAEKAELTRRPGLSRKVSLQRGAAGLHSAIAETLDTRQVSPGHQLAGTLCKVSPSNCVHSNGRETATPKVCLAER